MVNTNTVIFAYVLIPQYMQNQQGHYSMVLYNYDTNQDTLYTSMLSQKKVCIEDKWNFYNNFEY